MAAARWLPLVHALATFGVPGAAMASAGCAGAELAVQVLGSGGPAAESGRASPGYLLWQGGRSRILVDAGGGVFVRFGEAGARIEDLELIAITHLHVDHVADLPAILKTGFFSGRSRPLLLAGPDGNEVMPAVDEFVRILFDPAKGAFRYLSGFLDGSGGLFRLDVHTVPAPSETPRSVFEHEDFRVDAVGVRHGPLPALAYRIISGGKWIVFSGDLNGDNPAFVSLARGADVLVMDHAVPDDADPVARRLHATPQEIGRMAGDAGVKLLLLSHRMGRTLGREEASLSAIRRHYQGPVRFAEDLQCVRIPLPVQAPTH